MKMFMQLSSNRKTLHYDELEKDLVGTPKLGQLTKSCKSLGLVIGDR